MAPLPFPLRMLIIGASETGKTFLVRKMLMRGDLGNKDELEVLVFSPCESSRQQPIYVDLLRRGWVLRIYDDLRKAVKSPRVRPKRLIIIDDVDGPSAGPGVIKEATRVFAVESHHANSSCIMISHHLKTGSPALRGSAPFVLLTAAREPELRGMFKDLIAPPEHIDSIVKYLLEPTKQTGPTMSGGLCRRHILYSKSPGTSPWWIIPNTYCGPSGAQPWVP